MTACTPFTPGPRVTSATDDVREVAVLAAPPVPAATSGRSVVRWLPAVVTLLGAGGFVALGLSGFSSDRGAMSLMFPVLMVGSTLATLAYGAGAGSRASDLDRTRDDYLSYLGKLAEDIAAAARRQREGLLRSQPAPDALWTVVGSARMWERRRADADFGRVRFGVGAVDATIRPVLAPPQTSEFPREEDPVTTEAARRFVNTYTTLDDVPVTFTVTRPGVIAVDGDQAAGLVRAVICQLAVWHSPAEAVVAVVGSPQSIARWDWCKWLPHNRHSRSVGADGPTPMCYRTVAEALDVEQAGHLVVVVDGLSFEDMPSLGDGVTVLAVGCTSIDRPQCRIGVTPSTVTITGTDGAAVARPDLMTTSDALVCARRLAGYRAEDHQLDTGWLAQMGIVDIARIEPKALWSNRSRRQLRVPLGTTAAGEVVELDINEAAENGMGPHGLCIGATGSGKSELLRAVALGMIAGHSPEALNLILVDFKGGATFLDLDRAAHVAAVITNLADEAHLVERMQDALSGEIHRRQQILRDAGNLAGIAEYRRVRASGPRYKPLPPLPALFVIVDEFSELLSCRPEFIDVFVAIGRLGRSLGIYLLLASQRLDEGRLRGLDAHLSYRICLKTLSPGESRAVLGVPDAYHLPRAPGAAYLKAGAAEPIQFQSVFVSSHPTTAPPQAPTSLTWPVLFTATPIDLRPTPVPAVAVGCTLIDTVLDAVAGLGPPAHPVWLAPLECSPALDTVLAQAEQGELVVPIGLADRIFEHRRTPMLIDLAGAAGNVAVVGAPQSGKTTALRTLILGMAATHHPHRVQVYCLDLGGGLAAMSVLPHVGAIAGRRDTDLVTRTVTEITALVRRREELFAEFGIDSIAEYRRRRSRGDLAGVEDPFGDVFLVVDGWATLRHDFENLEAAITALAAEGLSLGVHVVLSASRWADLRPALKDQIGTRIELRLGDPIDSDIDRNRACNVPTNRPGRGLTPDGMALTLALPRLDAAGTAADLAEATKAAGEMLTGRYGGHRAPVIASLPTHIDYEVLARDTDLAGDAMLLGIDEQCQPVAVDFGRQGHLVILGDNGSGKTAVLRTLCRAIMNNTSCGPPKLHVMDPRRSLIGLGRVDQFAGYATTTAQLSTLVADLVSEAGVRIGHRADRPALGSDLYLVIDDYDMATPAQSNPLAPLLDVLPYAGDIGLHLVLARRSAGAGRALYEPMLAAVREHDAMGLQLSVGTDEGPLLTATRPRPLPPGRGTLCTRSVGERLIQVAWMSPS